MKYLISCDTIASYKCLLGNLLMEYFCLYSEV